MSRRRVHFNSISEVSTIVLEEPVEYENRKLEEPLAPAFPVAMGNGLSLKSSMKSRPPRSSCCASCDLVPRLSLPGYLKDNVYLDDYHRPELRSVLECLQSLFFLHTETLNIWTHLLGAFGCAMLAGYFLLTSQSEPIARTLVAMYLGGAIFCMGVSATFHAFNCHSEAAYRLLAKLDYCGILLLTVTTCPPWLYFSVYCHWPALCFAYVALVLCLGVAAIAVVLQDHFMTPTYLHMRAALFSCVGCVGFLPITYHLFATSQSETWEHIGWLFTMGGFYLTGVTLYALRIPERFLPPGKCNIWFQSHQFLHVFVIGGVLSAYKGFESFMDDMSVASCHNNS